MTQRVDIPTSDIEQLLRQLARQADGVRVSRTTATLRILAMTEWSGRITLVCIAALTGIAVTLFAISATETPARARPAITASTSTMAKSDPLFSSRKLIRQSVIQTAPAAIATVPRSRFAFIRGGVDDVMLNWMPAKPAKTEARPKPRRPRLHASHKTHPKAPVRTAMVGEKRKPWLLDLIIRHVARGH